MPPLGARWVHARSQRTTEQLRSLRPSDFALLNRSMSSIIGLQWGDSGPIRPYNPTFALLKNRSLLVYYRMSGSNGCVGAAQGKYYKGDVVQHELYGIVVALPDLRAMGMPFRVLPFSSENQAVVTSEGFDMRCDEEGWPNRTLDKWAPFERSPTQKERPRGLARWPLHVQDARLFWHSNGSLLMHVMVANCESRYMFARNDRSYIARVDPTTGRLVSAPIPLRLPKYDSLGRPRNASIERPSHEKNWVPLSAGRASMPPRPAEAIDAPLYFEFLVEPRVVIRMNDSGASAETDVVQPITSSPTLFLQQQLLNSGTIRGGTPSLLLPRGNLYLGLGHMLRNEALQNYEHIFYMFEASPPFRIVGHSDLFIFPQDSPRLQPYVQFANGMSFLPDGSTVLIGFGVRDCDAYFVTIPLARIMTAMEARVQEFSIKYVRGGGVMKMPGKVIKGEQHALTAGGKHAADFFHSWPDGKGFALTEPTYTSSQCESICRLNPSCFAFNVGTPKTCPSEQRSCCWLKKDTASLDLAEPHPSYDLFWPTDLYQQRREELNQGGWEVDMPTHVLRARQQRDGRPVAFRAGNPFQTESVATKGSTSWGGGESRFVGRGCCRVEGGTNLLPWHLAPNRSSIAMRREILLEIGVGMRSAECENKCFAMCAVKPRCDAFDLRWRGQCEGQNQASCEAFCTLYHTAGRKLRPRCDRASGKMLCFRKKREPPTWGKRTGGDGKWTETHTFVQAGQSGCCRSSHALGRSSSTKANGVFATVRIASHIERRALTQGMCQARCAAEEKCDAFEPVGEKQCGVGPANGPRAFRCINRCNIFHKFVSTIPSNTACPDSTAPCFKKVRAYSSWGKQGQEPQGEHTQKHKQGASWPRRGFSQGFGRGSGRGRSSHPWFNLSGRALVDRERSGCADAWRHCAKEAQTKCPSRDGTVWSDEDQWWAQNCCATCRLCDDCKDAPQGTRILSELDPLSSAL